MISSSGVAVADDNTDAVWSGSGIDTEEWTSLPGSDDEMIHLPPAGNNDGYVYEARLACTDGDAVIFPACAAVMPPCSTGAGRDDDRPGTAIYWYRAAAGENPLAWHYLSGPECVYGEEPRDVLGEIAAQIAQEFQRSPVVPAKFGSQPGAHTLRGNETNVWAEAATQNFNLTMIGQQVIITATPVAYTWDYGDGSIWGPTPFHGAPLHEDRIGEQTQTSHVYTTTGRLAIGLMTHFDGTYTVNGGPELPIPGQGNIPSTPLPLTVWRAETHLYADNCLQNPQGVGC
ncbi:hypothetical protein ACFUCV_02515 [Specibacter sp. NPDC057265]|uniref:hypothetical protein n=1 Tax=Specibacter sp. NPDC057265 TaxID=3346075 RepID=UPI00363EA0AC